MLLEKSYEYGEHEGLGLIPGNVTPIEPDIPKGYKIPHIGWNALHFPTDRPKNPLFQDIEEGEFVYFVHSYHGTNCADSIIATTAVSYTHLDVYKRQGFCKGHSHQCALRRQVRQSSAEVWKLHERSGICRLSAVSYTHLDVYKRQVYISRRADSTKSKAGNQILFPSLRGSVQRRRDRGE